MDRHVFLRRGVGLMIAGGAVALMVLCAPSVRGQVRRGGQPNNQQNNPPPPPPDAGNPPPAQAPDDQNPLLGRQRGQRGMNPNNNQNPNAGNPNNPNGLGGRFFRRQQQQQMQGGGGQRPTNEQVEKLIKDLQEDLFKYQVDFAVITAQGAANQKGTIVKEDAQGVTFKLEGGQVQMFPWNAVVDLLGEGHFEPEGHRGGDTAMAMWALVSSDMSLKDARMAKAIKGYNLSTTAPGTYALSFRTNVYSHLIRWARAGQPIGDYQSVMKRDGWIMWNAMDSQGGYGYTASPLPGNAWPNKAAPAAANQRPQAPANDQDQLLGQAMQMLNQAQGGAGAAGGVWGTDHSNTQFGVYGVWAAEDALLEVPAEFWQRVDDHWKSAQSQDGGWGYGVGQMRGIGGSTATMTDAGMNSLYLVVDKYWSRQVDKNGYKPLKGFLYSEPAPKGMKETFAAINKGWKWIEGGGKGNDMFGMMGGGFGMYKEYGMQRLGLASGRKYIGGRDWFEDVVTVAFRNGVEDQVNPQQQNPNVLNLRPGRLVRGVGGQGLEDTAWRIMCMAFGRAPVLFNKLEHGTDEMDWNYYFRDVANVTDWLNHYTEHRHNWQIVSLKDDMYDLQDAPITIITGYKALELDDAEIKKLKNYLDLGGTVLFHPNLDSQKFKDSVIDLMQNKLYKDEGYEFSRVAKDHPIYTAYAKGEIANKIATVPIKAMSDKGRDFAFLIEGDIAGAWQLKMSKTLPEYHILMLNLAMYAAPDYKDLPGKLRPRPAMAAVTKKATVARIAHKGHSTANRLLYDSLAPELSQSGLGFVVKDQVPATAQDLAGVNLIHLTGHWKFEMTAAEQDAIKSALNNGAFLLIDPAYGKAEFVESGKALAKALGLQLNPIDPKTHALFKDAALKPNKAMRDFVPTDKTFSELMLNGKVVGMISEVDITAGATGDHVYGSPAISREGARTFWKNLVGQVGK